MTAEFELAQRIAVESVALAQLPLCHVRLMDDSRYPWLLLLPRRPGLVEWTELAPADLAALSLEIAQASRALGAVASFDKLNIGALGNIVRQMHVHVIGRSVGDAAWPDPVWGRGQRVPYAAEQRDRLVRDLAAQLA